MMTDMTHVLLPDGHVHTPGCHYGPDACRPMVLKTSGDLMLTRQRGQTAWSSRGETSYYPTGYQLSRVRWLDDERFHVVEVLEECEPGRRWRTAVATLVARMER